MSGVGDQAGSPPDVTERLLEAAVEVFGERGYEGARIHNIADRARVTTGAIYARWRSKREVFLAAMDYTTAYRLTYFTDHADRSAVENLVALGTRLREVSLGKHEDLRLEAFVSARRDFSLGEKVSQFFAVESSNLATMIGQGKQAGDIDQSLSTEAIVALCLCMELGAHLVGLSESPLSEKPTVDEWNDLIARLVAAVTAGPAATPATDP
ncbi:MAG: TetR/AcrR family transcriptional regulator [bacterium]|nr:TetR/AcrR family transcriptional regulator [bacterium]